VGKLVVNFPYEAEVAGASYDEIKKQISEPNSSPRYSFSDGETPWSSRIFYLGPILISSGMHEQKISSLRKYFVDERNRTIEFFKTTDTTKSNKVGEVVNISKNTVAWNVGKTVSALTVFDAGLVVYDISRNKSLEENMKEIRSLSVNISHRKIFEIPPGPGLCMPYAFVKTSDFDDRGVTAAYKFIKHPDVTVWISEKSSTTELDNVREKNKQPKNIINSFWAQYETLKGVNRVEPMSSGKNGASIIIAERKGIASFVNIKREGGVEDFGYYASARGESGNEDAPDIDIYVIRNSSFASAEGPVNQEEFMRIVEVLQSSLALKRN
jgi:hypothetical protein